MSTWKKSKYLYRHIENSTNISLVIKILVPNERLVFYTLKKVVRIAEYSRMG